MTRLKYKGNTFIKEMNDKILVRVTKKEYLFEKSLISYNLLIKILKFFKNVTNINDFVEQEKLAGNEEKSMSHLYLLMKIGSIAQVDETFVESDESNYLYRNYEDYAFIMLKEKLPVYYLNNNEEFNYLGLGIYLTTYLEENIVCLIENNEQFIRLANEFKLKTKREKVSKKVIELLEYYTTLLSWDYYAKKRKFNSCFVLTKRLEIINYEPINIDDSQFVEKEVENLQLNEPHQVVAALANYLIQHPSFFLNYNIDKNEKGGYIGSYRFKGYSFGEVYTEGESYLKALMEVQSKILSTHPHFAEKKLKVMNYDYKKGDVIRYHEVLYKKTGVLIATGGS